MTLKAHARLVEISANVQSRVAGRTDELTKEDFSLKEDGKEVPIRYFSHNSEKPLVLAILVDTSGSQESFVEDEIRGADLFIEGLLDGTKDRAALIQFDRTVSQLGSLTNSISKLEAALPMLARQVPETSSSEPEPASWTVLHDAVYTTAKTVLAHEDGRKVIVLLTDGCDFGSRTTLAQAIEQAQRADAKLYSILYTHAAEDRCIAELNGLSTSTGGTIYTVSKEQPLRSVLGQISNQLKTGYELGYIPTAGVAPNSYHRLELRMKDRHLMVKARTGFYAAP